MGINWSAIFGPSDDEMRAQLERLHSSGKVTKVRHPTNNTNSQNIKQNPEKEHQRHIAEIEQRTQATRENTQRIKEEGLARLQQLKEMVLPL